ncbi:MAG: VOC family protein [Anaerolineae bacterium]|nr:VOC family protein [Anaerolineae bacterium]
MQLNHINLTVTDVVGAAQFLEKYFGMRNQGGDSKVAVLFDDNGLMLTLMKTGQGVRYPRTFHIGFIQESEAHVNAIHQRLKEDGFEVAPPQQSHAWTFYVDAPGGFTVEVLS